MKHAVRVFAAALLGCTALSSPNGVVLADDAASPGAEIEALDTSRLAIEAAPVLPDAGHSPALSGIPLRNSATSDAAVSGPEAQPSAGPPAPPAINWSGYVNSGIVYRGGN